MKLRLPRPLWLGIPTALLVVAAVGLPFGLPIYRQHVRT
jgi:ABC-type branched-subunit amino acid transport system permease subunit